MAASKDDERAQIALGDMHYSGLGTEKNALEAIKLWTKAANVGRVDAINKIGYAYLQNNGIDIDPQKAAEYFSVAVKQNDALAQFALGALYYDGQGVKKDHQKALELWTEAAKQGHAMACKNVGFMYRDGQGVEANEFVALEWILKSVNITNVPS